MAPEVINLFNCRLFGKKGSTDAVDWWSLGVVIYKLLTGFPPFKTISSEALREMYFKKYMQCNYDEFETFTRIFGTVDFSRVDGFVTPEAVDIITGFLKVDPATRYGRNHDFYQNPNQLSIQADVETFSELRAHQYFKDVDWNAIETRAAVPPYVPPVSQVRTSTRTNNYITFEEVIRSSNKSNWFNDPYRGKTIRGSKSDPAAANEPIYARNLVIPDDMQSIFSDWNYISPEAIEQESKVSRQRSKYWYFLTNVK